MAALLVLLLWVLGAGAVAYLLVPLIDRLMYGPEPKYRDPRERYR